MIDYIHDLLLTLEVSSDWSSDSALASELVSASQLDVRDGQRSFGFGVPVINHEIMEEGAISDHGCGWGIKVVGGPAASVLASWRSIGAVSNSSSSLWNFYGHVTSLHVRRLVMSLVTFPVKVVAKRSFHVFSGINLSISNPAVVSIWVHPEGGPVVALVSSILVVVFNLCKSISPNREVAGLVGCLVNAVPSIDGSSGNLSLHRGWSSFNIWRLHELWSFVASLSSASTWTNSSVRWSESSRWVKTVFSLRRELLKLNWFDCDKLLAHIQEKCLVIGSEVLQKGLHFECLRSCFLFLL